jgi:hypothetical protein
MYNALGMLTIGRAWTIKSTGTKYVSIYGHIWYLYLEASIDYLKGDFPPWLFSRKNCP